MQPEEWFIAQHHALPDTTPEPLTVTVNKDDYDNLIKAGTKMYTRLSTIFFALQEKNDTTSATILYEGFLRPWQEAIEKLQSPK